jgi:hypothetical protein
MSQSSRAGSVKELEDWVKSARPGDKVAYHVGRTATGDVCHAAMALSDAGLVSLVQRRVSPHGAPMFQYEAQRTRTKLTQWGTK